LGTPAFVAPPVIVALGVPAAIDFDNEPFFSASKVGDVCTDRKLASEFVAAELTAFWLRPQHGLIVAPPEVARTRSNARLSPASGNTFAPSGHFSPSRGERKGASLGELTAFERGRRGRQSRPEWGSTIHSHV
jgi:hypothetical protein